MSATSEVTCSNVFEMSKPLVHCLGRVESIWLYTTALAGLSSTIAVLGVFIYVLRNALRYRVRSGRWPDLTTKPMDVYLLSLFFADLLHAVADLLSLAWVNEGSVHIGSVCTAQGIIILLGANSIAASTFAITIHTFSVLWFRKGTSSGLFAMFVVAAIWAYIILFNVILVATHKNLSDVYAPTPSWCGIANHYLGYKIVGEYLWLWLALLVSFLVYIPLSVLTRGHITISEGKWPQISRQRLFIHPPRLFYAMIVYPVIYTIIVLPFSIVRWHGLTHGTTGVVSTLSTKAIWGLSGVLDVSVFLVTRRKVLSFDDDNPEITVGIPLDSNPEDTNVIQRGSMESYGRLPDMVEGS